MGWEYSVRGLAHSSVIFEEHTVSLENEMEFKVGIVQKSMRDSWNTRAFVNKQLPEGRWSCKENFENYFSHSYASGKICCLWEYCVW